MKWEPRKNLHTFQYVGRLGRIGSNSETPVDLYAAHGRFRLPDAFTQFEEWKKSARRVPRITLSH